VGGALEAIGGDGGNDGVVFFLERVEGALEAIGDGGDDGVVFFLEWPRDRFLKRQAIVYKKREREREIS
jgi:hypothetical protein